MCGDGSAVVHGRLCIVWFNVRVELGVVQRGVHRVEVSVRVLC